MNINFPRAIIASLDAFQERFSPNIEKAEPKKVWTNEIMKGEKSLFTIRNRL
jgi:hypothetical protein